MFTPSEAEKIALELFGISGTADQLPGYVDFNFKIKSGDSSFVLKISTEDDLALLKSQNKVLLHLKNGPGNFPEPVYFKGEEHPPEKESGNAFFDNTYKIEGKTLKIEKVKDNLNQRCTECEFYDSASPATLLFFFFLS